MSIKVLDRVLGVEGVTTAEKLVLIILADYADDNGVCWPSMETIARKALVTERGARGIIRRLESAGYLETEVSKGRASSRYRVLPDPEQNAGFNPERNSTNPEPNDTNPERRDTQPGTGVPPNRHEPS